MENQNKKSGKVKGFLKGLVEKLDKKLEEKAKNTPCCAKKDNSRSGSCCS